MGYAYNDLVAPAILYGHPGITREEFVRLLDKTHSSNIYEYKAKQPWDYYNKNEDERYHKGLGGLAGILGLEYTQRFREFQQPWIDENKLLIKPPCLLTALPGKRHKFEVVVHERNVFEEPRQIQSCSWSKLGEGDIWEETMIGFDKGFVLKIIKEKRYSQGTDEDSGGGPEFFYDMIIRPFYADGRTEKFKSEQDLYAKWPQFHPDFVRDWSKERGHFTCTGPFGGNDFLWLRRQEKYYFDDATFDKISASFRCSGSLGYVDLILTGEAIKHRAWKVLSYRGLQHFPQFLKDFPDIIPVYERAVWDSHTSISAKLQKMSVSEFLRFRMPGG